MLDAKIDTLLAIEKHGTFSRAAETLSLTQPAVSHQISLLEQELGVKLFERGKRGLAVTEEGEVVLKYARRMKALEESMRDELNRQDKELRRLRVGVTHTSESNKVALSLARYSSRHPGIHITIISDTIKNLYHKLDSYELDLAIVDEKPGTDRFEALKLDTDSLVCVVSPENPLAAKEKVSIEELKRQKLILRLPGSETRIQLESSLSALQISLDQFDVIMEVDNIATIKECVRKGLGISVLAKSACQYEVRKKKLAILPVENLSLIRERSVVYRRDYPHSEVIREIFLPEEDKPAKKKKTDRKSDL